MIALLASKMHASSSCTHLLAHPLGVNPLGKETVLVIFFYEVIFDHQEIEDFINLRCNHLKGLHQRCTTKEHTPMIFDH